MLKLSKRQKRDQKIEDVKRNRELEKLKNNDSFLSIFLKTLVFRKVIKR